MDTPAEHQERAYFGWLGRLSIVSYALSAGHTNFLAPARLLSLPAFFPRYFQTAQLRSLFDKMY